MQPHHKRPSLHIDAIDTGNVTQKFSLGTCEDDEAECARKFAHHLRGKTRYFLKMPRSGAHARLAQNRFRIRPAQHQPEQTLEFFQRQRLAGPRRSLVALNLSFNDAAQTEAARQAD